MSTFLLHSRPPCPCGRNCMKLPVCEEFRSMSSDERRSFVLQNRYCLNCLARSHERDRCTSVARCALCNTGHHTWLHHNGTRVQSDQFKNKSLNHSRNPTRVQSPPLRGSFKTTKSVGVQTEPRQVQHIGTQCKSQSAVTYQKKAISRLQDAHKGLTYLEEAFESLNKVMEVLR